MSNVSKVCILWSYFWTTGSLPSCKIKKKEIWLATWNFDFSCIVCRSTVWFLFVFTLTCWYEGCRCSAGGVLHSGIFFCQWRWNSTYQVCEVFFFFCVTTGSRGAIYKCHPSNTFCTHVATCHPTPTSLLHCGNSPVTGIFLAKFRWNTADPIWALQMICVINFPVLQQTVIWTFSACGFNVTQSCIFTETDSHWWPLCQIRGRRLSVFLELNCARSALSVLTSLGR